MMAGFSFRKKLKSLLAAVTILVVPLWLSGCFDATEVENLNVVAGIGVDLIQSHKVQVTLEVFRPAKSGQSATESRDKRQSFIVTATGDTIEDALSKFSSRSPRRLYYPHNVLFIFGRTYAEAGLNRAFDYLERDRAYRRNGLLLVADETAAEVLKAHFVTPQVTSLGIRQLIDVLNSTSEVYNTEQLTFLRQYLEPSHTALSSIFGLSAMGMPEVEGLALVKQGKLEMTATGSELSGLLWMLGEIRQVPLTVFLNPNRTTDEKSTLRILRSYRTIRWTSTGKQLSANIAVTARAEVDHVGGSKKLTPQVVRKLEAAAEDHIANQMKSSMAAMQEHDIDGAQLGTSLHRDKPRVWKQYASRWNDVYPTVKVTYHVRVNILKTGLSGQPPTGAYSTQGSLPPQK